jgi:hypothetical protein
VERGGHRFTNPPTLETGVEVLIHFSKVMRGVPLLAGSEYSLVGHLRLTVEWGTVGAYRPNEEEGVVHSFFAESENRFPIGLSRTCTSV